MAAYICKSICLMVMCGISSTASGQMIIAHRGASHDAPENTLSAFELAIEQGADGFEGDFYLTKDGRVICLHDADTERVAGKKLLATKASFDELRALDVGSWKGPPWKGEQMPTLEEALAAVTPGKKIFIELKSGAEIVAPLAKILAKSPLSPEQIVIISFSEKAIAESKKQLPQYKACWLCKYKKQKDGKITPTVDAVAATLRRIHADGLDTQGRTDHVDEEFIRRLRELGCSEFHVWTIDDPKVAAYYAKLGAASITTNRPGWLRKKMIEVGGQ
jgi:glycerophosphoryl diester phosphodiesterase